MIPAFNRKCRTGALGVLLGVMIAVGCVGNSRAFEINEEDMPDVKFLQGIMKSLGLQRGEDNNQQRERSPLVVPPSRNLPPPITSSTNEKNPAWPKDPDVKRRKEAKAERKTPSSMTDEALERMRPLRPNEVRTNNAPPGASNNDRRITDYSAPIKPSELGYKGGLFQSLFNAKEEEYATFTGETPRTNLIEPPAGYRTPSPAQPYGAGKEKWSPTPVDRLLPTR